MRREALCAAFGSARSGALSLCGVLFVVSCGRVGYDLTSKHARERDAAMQVVDSGRGDAGATGSGGSSSGGAPASGGAAAADASGAAGREGGVSSGGAAPVDAGARKDAAIDAAMDAGRRCTLSPQ